MRGTRESQKKKEKKWQKFKTYGTRNESTSKWSMSMSLYDRVGNKKSFDVLLRIHIMIKLSIPTHTHMHKTQIEWNAWNNTNLNKYHIKDRKDKDHVVHQTTAYMQLLCLEKACHFLLIAHSNIHRHVVHFGIYFET